ncbi:putative DNA binding domain [Penicillium expansum]|uniref:Putative DNA binding domain n=1 Tax=Penicillium expansum TaxID=27334 RepID=A0A0A2JAD3_PENEN|nr:putative DNA binding domain [Penicillium expansum]KGO38264.1 putative DNA binding domain [Penicillium expansum]KGO51751.1 putative DNA binding domain [Penicillium expansum]KGO54541.1 putative DNA binding domain [Penicillium expansum]
MESSARTFNSPLEAKQPFPPLLTEDLISPEEPQESYEDESITSPGYEEIEVEDDADFQSHYSLEHQSFSDTDSDDSSNIERNHPFRQSSSSLHGPNAFAPPFYNRPPTPLPPSPSLTSLLRPPFSTTTSRPTTPDSSDVETPNDTEAAVAKSARRATTVPRASPKVPTYEYYGFVLYLASSLAFLFYLLWSYLPSPFLHQLGIYYYPNRWWSLAIPAWLVMLLIYIYAALATYNTGYLTLPMHSIENIVDEVANVSVIDGKARRRPGGATKMKPGATSYQIMGPQNRKVNWREIWSEGTDAVMDVPPSTPPSQSKGSGAGQLSRAPITPEQQRRMEINRMKAKALREKREAELSQAAPNTSQPATGAKRSFTSMAASNQPANMRDASSSNRPLDSIKPARNFTSYVDYDFSKMTDTKGGFLTQEDDPFNKQLHVPDGKEMQMPAHMTQKEWERHQILQSLKRNREGPFEPGLSVLDDKSKQKTCRECGSLEIDWKWEEELKCCICHACKEKHPEKYSLLTKTEAKEDYLLTDREYLIVSYEKREVLISLRTAELRDEELLPRLERPNPHKSTWNSMMLYLRYQVEEYAFSDKKWGSTEALDAEFERRENDKKRRREAKFKTKLQELKKRTRVEAYRRNRQGASGGDFGDDLGSGRKHVHQWGRSIDNPETGIGVKTCIECGMEVEELEF